MASGQVTSRVVTGIKKIIKIIRKNFELRPKKPQIGVLIKQLFRTQPFENQQLNFLYPSVILESDFTSFHIFHRFPDGFNETCMYMRACNGSIFFTNLFKIYKNKSIKRAPICSICLSCIVQLCFHQSLMQPTKHNNNTKISTYFGKHTTQHVNLL